MNLLEQKIAEENKKSAEEMAKKADYKIQIWFRSERSINKPLTYSLSFWESGKRLHGGGDEMMYICRRHKTAQTATPFEVANVLNKTENKDLFEFRYKNHGGLVQKKKLK